ncbi:MAG: hypothetical protein ABIH39_07900 [Candidatus Margulisiibacteriota bacterium]
MRSKNNSGVALVLVIVLLTTVVTIGIVYLQVMQTTRDDRVARFWATQALYLAETAAEEGGWFVRNVSPNFTGTSNVRTAPGGEYLFNVVNNRNVVGYGYVPAMLDARVMRTVTYNCNLPLTNAATRNIEGYNYAVWLGEGDGADFDWPPEVIVKGGSVHANGRNIIFSGSGDKIIDRKVQAYGAGVTINVSGWSGGSPAAEIVTVNTPVMLSYNYWSLLSAADIYYDPGRVYAGTTENPVSFTGLAYVVLGNTKFTTPLVYSGNMTVVAGPKFAPLINAKPIEIWDDLTPLHNKDSLTLISGTYITIGSAGSQTLNINASIYAKEYVEILGSGPVNIYGNLAIAGDIAGLPLRLPAGVTLNVYYDSRYFIPTFNETGLLPNPVLPYWNAQ